MSYSNLTRSVVFTVFTAFSIFTTAFADDDDKDKLAVDKVEGSLSVMVLGSGAPISRPNGRASAGYLIFVDGEAKILMDVGGGTFQRIAKSGVNLKDLEIVLLSHLHIDHMGDLTPVVKSMYFQNRLFNAGAGNDTVDQQRSVPFNVYGPGASAATFPPFLGADPTTTQYPATLDFINDHFDINEGVDRYLHIFTRAINAGTFAYTATDVNSNWKLYETTSIPNDVDGLEITAVGVNHGPVPALGFRIDYKGKSIVYSGDTSSIGDNMVTLSTGADLLIYDTAITDDAPDIFNTLPFTDGVFKALHTTPTRIGEVARDAGVKKLVLSHITPVTEPNLDAVKDVIKDQGFSGKIKVAKDLKVYNLDD